MNKVSNIKLNILLEKLYVESTINKLYEEISDFDWIENTKPSFFDPDFTFNGYEYWVDVSKLSLKDRIRVRDYILTKVSIDVRKSYCPDIFRNEFLAEQDGMVIHCGVEHTDYKAEEGQFCCMGDTSFDEDENNTESVYVDGTEIIYFLDNNSIKESVEPTKEEEKNLYKKIIDDLGLTRRLIFTFSTGVAAMVGPVTSLLEGSGVHLNEVQVIMLIISGIASAMGEGDNKIMIAKLKEEGIYQYLSNVISFITNIKQLIDTILDKTLKGVHGLTEVLGFTFVMVPAMKVLNELIETYDLNFDSLQQLFGGLLAGSISYGVKHVVDKIRKRLS